MKILVTGGSGFIGRYFYERLHDRYQLTIYDLVAPGWDASSAVFCRGDIRDLSSIRAALRGQDAVLHLAAAHHDFGIAESTYYSVNADGAQILCDAIDAVGIGNICFFSTVGVFGDAPEPHHEDSPTEPNSPYGGSKLEGERIFREWTGRGNGRRCLVIRPTVTFGPRNFANVYNLIRQVHRRRFLSVGTGHTIKSMAYVENLVDAAIYLWERRAAASFDVYHYVDKPDLDTRGIVAAVSRSLGRRPPSLHLPLDVALAAATPFDLAIRLTGKNLPVSSARIRRLCIQTKFEADKVAREGFRARVPLEEGIDRMVKWYLAEGQHQPVVRYLPPAGFDE